MEIYIENNTDSDIEAYRETVEKTVRECLRFEGIEFDTETSVTFVSEREIAQLNSEYRNIDSVTDVLSFPMLVGKDEVAELKMRGQPANITALGDIVICVDRAVEQAEEYGHGIQREIGFLTAHSMLHLLGYDHMNDGDEREMFGKQEAILQNINLKR